MSVTPLPRDPEDEQRERSPRRSPPPAPGQAPSLIDIAPSILAEFNLPAASTITGKNVFV